MQEVKKIATRESFGNALISLAEEFPQMIVLDSDLTTGTKTCMFQKAYSERHINCGIAESNMMGMAAGMSVMGYIPVVSTFAMFAAGRAFEQIRNSIGYPHLNVKICATHGGISVGEDGATHQCNEDMALMRAIPGMVVLNPSDDAEAKAALKAALIYEGPVYIRFGRLEVDMIHEEGEPFTIGKGRIERDGTDITIFATGICVQESLKAAEMLMESSIDAQVVNLASIKPLDRELIFQAASKTGKAITVEEHTVLGGMGSAVCEVLAGRYPIPVKMVGIPDIFGESGDAKKLLHIHRLDAFGIATETEAFLRETADLTLQNI